MTETPGAFQDYGGQLGRWVAAFAAGHYQDLEGDLEESSTPHDVKRFLINSFGNRYTWLMREQSELGKVFPDLPALVRAYVRTVPRAPYDITAPADEERFLIWLAETQTLTSLQSDFVTLQRGEYAVGTEARRNRPGHLRFQHLREQAGERLPRLGVDPALRIHLNPIRFAGELRTATFAPGAQSLPIGVLFYAAGTSVRATLLEDTMAEAIAVLAARGPCTLKEWAADEEGMEKRAALAGELAGVGLVAFD